MEFERALRSRRMVRNLRSDPLDEGLVDRLVDLARRAPSAGNTQALDFLVLDTPADVERYWDTTLPEPGRSRFRWAGLLRAPVLVIVTVRPQSYVERYSEADKLHSGLGDDVGQWPVPYWWVDAGAASQNLLLAAVDAGLGACLFGLFEHESGVATVFGVPADRRLVATIALGWPVDDPDEPGRSAARPRRPLSGVIHRGHW